VMGNHLHVIVRQRPDLAKDWSDEEIARRWLRLYPKRVGGDSLGGEAESMHIKALLGNAVQLAAIRQRLGNLSWFMRALCEPIARRANREDGATGHFFEGRFRSIRLLDDAALLACSIYVDLNPIRAGIAKTPERSEHTSAFERIEGRRQNATQAAKDRKASARAAAQHSAQVAAEARRLRGDWLAPMSEGRAGQPSPVGAAAGVRASNDVLIPLDLEDYLRLLDWTGRELRGDKRGSIPADLEPILDRLQIRASSWLSTIDEFAQRFKRAVGAAAVMIEHAQALGRYWLHGVRHCRAVFK